MSHRRPKREAIDDAATLALVAQREEARARVRQLEREVAMLTRKCDRAVALIVDWIFAEGGGP